MFNAKQSSKSWLSMKLHKSYLDKAQKMCNTYNSLKYLNDWEPITCEVKTAEWLREVIVNANKTCKRVTLKDFDTARDRIYADGYYGPIQDSDWKEQDGRPMTMKRAKCIINEALNTSFTDIEFEHPDFGDAKLEGDAVKKEVFKFVYKIYGRYNI